MIPLLLFQSIAAPMFATFASGAAQQIMAQHLGMRAVLTGNFNPLSLAGVTQIYAIANPGKVNGTIVGAIKGAANGIKGSLVGRRVQEFEGIAERASNVAAETAVRAASNSVSAAHNALYQDPSALEAAATAIRAGTPGAIPLPDMPITAEQVKDMVYTALKEKGKEVASPATGQLLTYLARTIAVFAAVLLFNKYIGRSSAPAAKITAPDTTSLSPSPNAVPTDAAILGQASNIIYGFFITCLPYLVTLLGFGILFYYIHTRLEKTEKRQQEPQPVIDTTLTPVESPSPPTEKDLLEKQLNALRADIGRLKKNN